VSQALTTSRTRIEGTVKALDQKLSTLEQRVNGSTTDLKQAVGSISSRAQGLAQRAARLAQTIQKQSERTAQVVGQWPEPKRAPAHSKYLACKAELEQRQQGFSSAAKALQAPAAQCAKDADGLSQEVLAIVQKITTARNAAKGQLTTALGLLRRVDEQLKQLQKTLAAKLDALEAAGVGNLKSMQAQANAFVGKLQSAAAQLEQAVDSVLNPVLGGAAELQNKVTDVVAKAKDLMAQFENVTTTVVGAVDQVPVNALPTFLAQPTVATLSQLSSQFGTQLKSVSELSGTQLQAVATQISQAIEQGQSQLSAALDAALNPLFQQVDKILEQIRQKQQEIGTALDSALAQLTTQTDQVLATVQTQVDQLTAPVLSQLNQLTEQVSSAGDRACADVEAALGAIAKQVAQIKTSADAVLRQCSEIERAIAQTDAEALRRFTEIRTPA
jgi:DNA anti-recombination protein RmuC